MTIDYHHLNRDLDRTKSTVFLDKHNAAFLGSLMCSLNFKWVEDLPTAGTDGVELLWNPKYFEKLPPKSRTTDLSHELWHVALLHNLRRGSRNHEIWNIACDIRIDLMLEQMGFTFEGINGVPRDKKYIDWVEEDIYDDLIKDPPPSMGCTCCASQMPETQVSIQATINTVVQAMHQAKLSGQAGNLPGAIEKTLKKFLEPIIPWQVLLMQFFTDLLDEDYSWARPNRRYQDMYLPSRFTDDGRLEHLAYYLDISGSIQDKDALRFSSEVKFIQEVLKPQKLSLIQFDTEIQKIKEFKEEEPFDDITIVRGGGTCLVKVRDHINETKPTAAIIFSDMEVDPMQPLDYDIPVIWVAIRNRITPPFGKAIYID
jgi:predicted metal-dependent peptidase